VRTTQPPLWLVAVLVAAVVFAIIAAVALSSRDDGPTAASATETTTAPDGDTAVSCQPAAFLPVLQRELDRQSGPRLASVTVERCRDGYARVVGVPADAGGDGVQAVLRDSGGSWRVLVHGRRIECDGSDRAVAEACARLGDG
jgi:hypothetical protein